MIEINTSDGLVLDSQKMSVDAAELKEKQAVAVLLAAFNGMVWIQEQIESILKQEEVAVTVFVSVDLSSDGTEVWVENYARGEDRVVVLPLGLRFGGAGRNFFRLMKEVDLSRFSYVSFADQDDIWHRKKLIAAINALNETKSDGYSSNVTAFWPTGETLLIDKSQPQRQWDYLFECAGPGCTYVMTICLAEGVKKVMLDNWSDVERVGGHDWFIYAFARANGFRWFIDQWPSMLYRQHGGNQTGVNKGLKALLFRIKKIASGWGIEQSALIAKMVGKDDSEFVQGWSHFRRFGFLRLAFSAKRCRRKPIDRVFFVFACLLLVVIGKR